MSNKVSVEIGANVQGFEQGMNKATESAKKYETETRKISENTVNFNKQFREAKKTVKDLAASYAALGDEAKRSGFGKEMARQLEEAKQRAAELIDLQGDLNAELKNLASDTRVLDTMSEGFGVIADTASTAMGVIAQFTGNEEDARKAVLAFTTAQSALGAMTKIQNALQKQSNTMLAIGKVQTLAAAAAEKIKTTAEAKGIATTKAATAAQAAFNAVAKANPYVLLATAIIGAIGVVASYIAITKKSAKAEEEVTHELTEHQKAMEEVNNTYSSKYASTLAELTIKYTALRNSYMKLNSEYAKTEFIKKYKKELENVVGAVNSVAQADQLLIDNTEAVKKSFIEKAKAAALYAKLQDLLIKKFEAEQKAQKEAYKPQAGIEVRGADVERYGLIEGVHYSRNPNEIGNGRLTEAGAAKIALEAATKNVSRAGAEYDAEINSIVNMIDVDNANLSSSLTGNKKSGKNHTAEDIKAAAGSIAAFEKELSDLQEKAKNGALPDDLKDPEKFKAEVKRLTTTIENLKIEWGFAEPKTKLQELQNKLDEAQKSYVLAVNANDKDAQQAALKIYYSAQKELDDYKLQITIEPTTDPQKTAEERKEIQDIVNEALNPKEAPKFDFSGLPEEVQKEANKALEEYNRLYEARETLTKKMNAADSSDTTIAESEAGLERIAEIFDLISGKVGFFQEWSNAIEEANKKTQKLQKTVNAVGDVAGAAGDMFGALGDAAEDESLQAIGIVAKAVATVALSFAQALTTCKTWYEWLAFGVSGIATMASMISQIKSLTSGYTEGGVRGISGMVGGSSYHGDNIFARLNSGEMILNKRQQKNLFNLLDNGGGITGGSSKVEVTGVIRGTDLLLVQKNANKKLSKAGSTIKIQ